MVTIVHNPHLSHTNKLIRRCQKAGKSFEQGFEVNEIITIKDVTVYGQKKLSTKCEGTCMLHIGVISTRSKQRMETS